MKKTEQILNSRNGQALRCGVCSNTDNHQSFRIREMMFGTREVFEYFQCKSCGCLQISKIPTNLGQYYPHSYYSFQIKSASDRSGMVMRFLQKQRVRSALFARGLVLNRMLRPFLPYPKALYRCGKIIHITGITSFDSSFLDVGCGSHSWWLNGLNELGFTSLLGADPYIEKTCSSEDVTILKAPIQKVTGQFDLISFHHSFEHVADPFETLVSARNMLSPHGTCLLRIPIVSSEAWEKYGINWVELDAPRHLFLHSIRSISFLAEQAGLEIYQTVFETDEFEIYGSKQYELDIPLMAENSYFVSPEKSIFAAKDIQSFHTHANELNRTGRAGRAIFYMRQV